MKHKNKTRDLAINYSLKICLSTIFLIASYYALQFIILKANLVSVGPVLMSLFYINCVIVGLKIFKK